MVNRREFLDALAVGAAGLAIRANAKSYGQILGSNSRLNFAVIGLNSRAYAHLSALKARCPDTHIVGVCDREGDVYDVFVAERPAGVDWLVRAGWNRSVAHPEKYLWEAIAATPALGQTELQIPGSGNTIARTARLTMRCAPVRLRPAPPRPFAARKCCW